MDCLIRRSPRQVHTILDLDVFAQLHNLLFLPQIVPQAFFQNQVFYYDDYYLMTTYWCKNIEYLDIFTQNFWIEEQYIDYLCTICTYLEFCIQEFFLKVGVGNGVSFSYRRFLEELRLLQSSSSSRRLDPGVGTSQELNFPGV